MARKHIIKNSDYPYHITARTNNKEFFPLPMRDCWNLYSYHLERTISKYNVEIHCFVLMNNHFHLLVSTPESNIDIAMRYFMSATSKGIGFASKKINHLYGGPYKWKILDTSSSYLSMLKYCYRNPIRANICASVEDYNWSTIQNNAIYKISAPVVYEDHLPSGVAYLNWLNEPTLADIDLAIKKSLLRNGTFKFVKDEKRYLLNQNESPIIKLLTE